MLRRLTLQPLDIDNTVGSNPQYCGTTSSLAARLIGRTSASLLAGRTCLLSSFAATSHTPSASTPIASSDLRRMSVEVVDAKMADVSLAEKGQMGQGGNFQSPS